MSYSYSVSNGECTINVTPVSGYQNYRVFARYTEDTSSEVYNEWFTTTSSFSTSFPVISGRSYTINVGYNNTTTWTDVSTWMGRRTFTAPEDPAPIANNKVYIYDGNTWKQATPYIYDNGSWKQATPYIYDNGSWKRV